MPDDAAPETGQSKAKVFISYSRKDIAFAERLEAALKARGFEPLINAESGNSPRVFQIGRQIASFWKGRRYVCAGFAGRAKNERRPRLRA
jgi:hypothetical protein